jgi:TatD DNase family protein
MDAAVLAELGLPALPEPLHAPTTDAHTHLDAVAERSGLDAAAALGLAAAVGITRIVQVGCDAADSIWAEAFAAAHPTVIANVALHPNEVARHPERLAESMAVIERLAGAGPHVRAIGETGLDYYRTTDPAAQARQREAFAAHIELAAAHRLTLVIHDRDAHADILDVLDGSARPDRVVMHCFSGDADHARRSLARGAWLSFPGVITYKANAYLREALAATPPERLLVETDAPYLTPVPARGRPNSSYLLPHTVRYVAELRGWDLAWTCQLLADNAVAAFGGPWGDGTAAGPGGQHHSDDTLTRADGSRDDEGRDSGNRDYGTRDSGSRSDENQDSGSRDYGTRDSGNRDDGSRDSGNRDDGSRDAPDAGDATP